MEVHNDRVHVRFRTSIGEDPTYEWIETSSDGLKEVSRPRRTQGGVGVGRGDDDCHIPVNSEVP